MDTDAGIVEWDAGQNDSAVAAYAEAESEPVGAGNEETPAEDTEAVDTADMDLPGKSVEMSDE